MTRACPAHSPSCHVSRRRESRGGEQRQGVGAVAGQRRHHLRLAVDSVTRPLQTSHSVRAAVLHSSAPSVWSSPAAMRPVLLVAMLALLAGHTRAAEQVRLRPRKDLGGCVRPACDRQARLKAPIGSVGGAPPRGRRRPPPPRPPAAAPRLPPRCFTHRRTVDLPISMCRKRHWCIARSPLLWTATQTAPRGRAPTSAGPAPPSCRPSPKLASRCGALPVECRWLCSGERGAAGGGAPAGCRPAVCDAGLMPFSHVGPTVHEHPTSTSTSTVPACSPRLPACSSAPSRWTPAPSSRLTTSPTPRRRCS